MTALVTWYALLALLILLLAFFLGAIMGGQVLQRLLGGQDLRDGGSGNLGATNALRTRGVGFALGVLAIDVLKGYASVVWLPRLQPLPYLPLLCGMMAALGHCYSPFAGFKGGKAVATLLGVFAGLIPAALPWLLLAFVIVLLLTGWVSAATFAATFSALAYALYDADLPFQIFTGLMSLLVLWRHQDNLKRLLAGQEPRFEKLWLLKPKTPSAP
jgi:glycerol-3-phosphate acyltransferase PlsY